MVKEERGGKAEKEREGKGESANADVPSEPICRPELLCE